jgi:hypothetical protein
MLDHRAKTVAVLPAVLALALTAPAPADEGAGARRACGGVQKAKPERDVSRGRPPLAIGDSPMLLALPNLGAAGYRANARGCRQYPEGLAVMRSRKRDGKLPRLVVIALGSNASITRDNIHEALDIIGRRKRTLGLVTPRELGGGSSSDAEVVRTEADRHRHRIVLLDWVKKSAGHSNWFQSDGLHLTLTGAKKFTNMLKRPLRDLPPPPGDRQAVE